MWASGVIPSIPPPSKEAREVTLPGSSSNPRQRDMPGFHWGRTIRGLPTWRNCCKEAHVEHKTPSHELVPMSLSVVPCVQFSSMGSPPKGEPRQRNQVETCSPRAPYATLAQISRPITPELSYSLHSPSNLESIQTPIDSSGAIVLGEDSYFTRPSAHGSMPFPTTLGPIPTFSRVMRDDSFAPARVGSGRREGERHCPPALEMMDSLDFLARLCERRGLLAGDDDSTSDEERLFGNDNLMGVIYHAS